MKKTILNGTQIDYDTSLEKLKKMILSPVMKDFCLACEVLSSKNSVEAYEIMKPYVNDKDKYRRLYTLKTIFAFSQARVELISFLENSILSDDILFSENALLVISNYEIKVSDALIISAVHRHMPKLYHALNSLKAIDVNEENYIKVIELFNKSNQSGQKEIIGNILMEKYLPAKACELFELFRIDKYPKIRLLSVELARKYGYNLIQFMKDIDGHVRSHAIGSMGRLSFLSKYIGIYNIDISDDLESAIIYNPYSNNHIYIEYEEQISLSEYTAYFSFQHIHSDTGDEIEKWIDDILAERIFAIEYFNGKINKFGGQISKEKVFNLTEDIINQELNYFGVSSLIGTVDNFKVRGWSGKNDFDGLLTEKNDNIVISILK